MLPGKPGGHSVDSLSPFRSWSEPVRGPKVEPSCQPPRPPSPTLVQFQAPGHAHLGRTQLPSLGFLPSVAQCSSFSAPGPFPVASSPSPGRRSCRNSRRSNAHSGIPIPSGRNKTALPSTATHVPTACSGSSHHRDLCALGAPRSVGRQTELGPQCYNRGQPCMTWEHKGGTPSPAGVSAVSGKDS